MSVGGGRRAARVFATLSFAVVVAACSSDGGEEAAEPNEAPITPGVQNQVDQNPEVVDEVLGAYHAASEASFAAFDPPDLEHPDLLETHHGTRLSNLQNELREMEADGVSLVGSIEPSATVTWLFEHTASVRVCEQRRTQQVDTDTGEPLSDEDETVLHFDAHMERIDGTWKVVNQEDVDEPCTPA